MDGTIFLDEYWLNFVVATALPMLTALITKRWSSSAWGAWVLLALSAISGTLASALEAGGALEPRAAIASTIVTFVTAVGVHYGLLKPAKITGSEGVIRKKVSGGLGKAENDGVLELEDHEFKVSIKEKNSTPRHRA